MNVTIKNFVKFSEDFCHFLPKVNYYNKLIKFFKSELVSFDFELTGISTNPQPDLHDLPFERYNKMRGAANKYSIIQVGLGLFIKMNENTYETRSYNIYVFPKSCYGYSPQFSMDTSAIEFNASHNMNWQMWITEGVPFLSKKNCEKISEKIFKEESNSEAEDYNTIKLSPDQKTKSDDVLKNLEIWVKDECSKNPFIIEENNGYLRRYYFLYLEKTYPFLTSDSVKEGKNSAIHCFKFNEMEKNIFQEEKKEKVSTQFNFYKGFTNIFEKISESKLPIVGHNCFFDILFWMSHFNDFLDPNFIKFKDSFHKLFPKIYDTKYIAKFSELSKYFELSSSLSDFQRICFDSEFSKEFFKLNIVIPEGFENYKSATSMEIEDVNNSDASGHYHEAGYDAFLTGIFFLTFKNMLGEKDFDKKFLNRLNLMNTYFSLNFDGNDPIISNSVIFVISEKGKDDNGLKDIKKELEKFNGFAKCRYNQSEGMVNYFLELDEKGFEFKEEFIKSAFKLKEDGFNIMSFEKYIESKLNSGKGKEKEKEKEKDYL